MKNSIKILEAHNLWRRGDDSPQCNPAVIGMAIDDCVQAAKRYEIVRTFSVQQYKELFLRCLNGENFDAMVDELIKEREE